MGHDAELPSGAAQLQRWEALVDRLMLAVGIESDTKRARSVALRAVQSEGPSEARLRAACEDLGLPVTLMRGRLEDAVRSVGPEHPAVAFDVNGDWALLIDRRRGKLRVERFTESADWMSRRQLAATLGLGGTLCWVAVSPPAAFRDPKRSVSTPDDVPPPSPWKRMRQLALQERHDIMVAVVYAVGVGVLALATPIAVQALVNNVAFGTLLQPLVVLTLLLFMGLVFAGVLRALQAWVVEILQRRLLVRLVDELSHRLPRVELAAFDRASGPELVNHFFDLFLLQKSAASLLVNGLEIILSAGVGMVVLAFYHPLLLAFDAVLIVVMVFILRGLGRGAIETAVKESKAKYEIASWLEAVAQHPIAFKLAGGPDLARRRTDQLAASYLTKRKLHFRLVFRQIMGSLSLYAVASAGMLGIGGWLVIERELTLGQFVAAELIVTTVVYALSKIGKYLETTYDLLASLDKIGQLADLPLERGRAGAMHPNDAHPLGAAVKVEGLRFGFGSEPLFRDVSLELAPGEHVALNGKSGAGRSVLADVILGLREPQAGRVSIDGFDVDDLDRGALRRRTALVRGREVVAGTIHDNVAFGRPEIGTPKIREALESVGLLDEVQALSEGLDTRLLPDGSPLSTGQASRLVMARAIAGAPSLLVVDGALDGLDPETRERVMDTVFAATSPWTLLAISHDAAIRDACTRVLTLEDGALRQATDHDA